MDVQLLLTSLIVLLAAGWLLRRVVKTWSRRGTGCGGCSCATPATPPTSATTTLVAPEQLTLRRR